MVSMRPQDCSNAFLTRIFGGAQPSDDLLLAVSSTHLHLLARKTRDLGCTCHDAASDQLLASGFHCPHVHGAADFWPLASIPTTAIHQVLVTFRTVLASLPASSLANSPRSLQRTQSVAKRTRDCVIICGDHRLHLEFEHNLARGSFLDAITAATQSRVDIDYIDTDDDQPKLKPSNSAAFLAAFTPTVRATTEALFQIQRSGLRLAALSKIALALQLTAEGTLLDPSVDLLLNTAATLAQALDEPDVNALAWLVSGFINGQRSPAKTGEDLALQQLQHTAKLARENSLPLLLSLALHCAADRLVASNGDAVVARSWMTEAARLLPTAAVDSGEKMQLHRKILELGGSTDRSAVVERALDLWSYFLAPNRSHRLGLVLAPVAKSAAQQLVPNWCYVQLKAPGVEAHRLRVVFSADCDVAWLHQELKRRLARCPLVHDEASTTDVQAIFSSDGRRLAWGMKLKALVQQDVHTLVAKVAFTDMTGGPVADLGGSTTVLCSQCHAHVALEDVEAHSETCS